MWNLSEASDEQRQTMLDALNAEKAAYEHNGLVDQAAAVQAQIDAWANPTDEQLERASKALAAAARPDNAVNPRGASSAWGIV